MSKIIDRIQKLLRLASNAGSEAEAALAAERAAALMAEHEIHEAELAVAAGEEKRVAEPIERGFEVTKTKKKVAWHMRIANAVAESYGAHAYWTGGRVKLFGRLSAVQAANYTTHYLMREVDKITDKEAPSTSYSKMYRNGFRLGCANRLASRIYAETRAKKDAALKAHYAENIEAAEAGEFASDPSVELASTSTALAIIEKDHKEVEDAYGQFEKHFGKPPRVGKVSSGNGYHAGAAAGNRMNITSGGKGLPKGQDTFPTR